MNVPLLIGAIVRQTTVLIAELATTGGVRAPLAQVADQVFGDLVRELERQGVSRKVSADMFGMTLRSYQRRIQRLGESNTERGRSLWEAVLAYLQGSGAVTRGQVLARFHRDDEAQLRGVLHDLTESGLVFASGTAADSVYRAASEDELGTLRRVRRGESLDELVWVIVYREGPVSREALLPLGGLAPDELDAALERLCKDGRIVRSERNGGQYSATSFVVPLGSPVGFEAAVFDQFQAMVRTIIGRLRGAAPELDLPQGLEARDTMGGSTYSFDLWSGHPHVHEALGLLAEYRRRVGELREKIETYNASVGLPPSFVRVTSYAGQSILQHDSAEDNGA
ncbi:MAG TPA: hypothetical protein VM686_13455 [Polyangiaceae bacterium]|jgi:hypothetical protein|nr:hypothetical protein [Polyangiaceae bacterium]